MMTAVEGLYGGLSALADTLQVERIGPMHQADQFNKELNQPAQPITIGSYASLPRYIRGVEQEL